MHGTGVYSTGVGSKSPALERFPDIKKKKKKEKKSVMSLLLIGVVCVRVMGSPWSRLLAPYAMPFSVVLGYLG